MKKISVIISLMLILLLLTSCEKSQKISREKMIEMYEDIYEFSQKDSEENPYFKTVSYTENHLAIEGDTKIRENLSIDLSLEDKFYVSKSIETDEETKKVISERFYYVYILDETLHYYENAKFLNQTYSATFTATKDQTFTLESFGSETIYNPYKEFLDFLNSLASKETQTLNILNLYNSMQRENYLDLYNVSGSTPGKNELRLDYYYEIQADAEIYNDAIEHYVLFKDNYVKEYYFKHFLGDTYFHTYNYDGTNVKRPKIDEKAYEVIDYKLFNLPRINMMIGY